MCQDEEWKKRLREKFIILMAGNEQEKQSLYANIGFVYQCYAPASVYKYYSDNALNINALKTNRMWYSAPSVFNDVFVCVVTVDEDKLFKSILQSYPGMQGVRVGSPIWKEMKALCERAHVAPGKVFPHNLRHLFARTFYSIEKDIAKLADILGHASINTTRIYIVSTGAEHKRKLEHMRLIV